ncbi:hypothetical protein KSP40_PGU020149 [Platanthera guangdongensis]|uniref:Uncharacterized protein n=1 Tax=Platanthera guangdongensis TaxID=2320717 RepID=A0ABR2LQT7_9ASPA
MGHEANGPCGCATKPRCMAAMRAAVQGSLTNESVRLGIRRQSEVSSATVAVSPLPCDKHYSPDPVSSGWRRPMSLNKSPTSTQVTFFKAGEPPMSGDGSKKRSSDDCDQNLSSQNEELFNQFCMNFTRSFAGFLSSNPRKWGLLCSTFALRPLLLQTGVVVRHYRKRTEAPAKAADDLPVDLPTTKDLSELPRPIEIPFQPLVANSVNIIGTVDSAVKLHQLSDGSYASVLILVSENTKMPEVLSRFMYDRTVWSFMIKFMYLN